MTEKVRELSDPESAVSKELSILSAASLLKWKKNAVGPKMLGFKVRLMRSVDIYNSLSLLKENKRKKKDPEEKDTREEFLKLVIQFYWLWEDSRYRL